MWKWLKQTLAVRSKPRELGGSVRHSELRAELQKKITESERFCAEVAGDPFSLFVRYGKAITFKEILQLCTSAQMTLMMRRNGNTMHLDHELLKLATLEEQDRDAAISRATRYITSRK